MAPGRSCAFPAFPFLGRDRVVSRKGVGVRALIWVSFGGGKAEVELPKQSNNYGDAAGAVLKPWPRVQSC